MQRPATAPRPNRCRPGLIGSPDALYYGSEPVRRDSIAKWPSGIDGVRSVHAMGNAGRRVTVYVGIVLGLGGLAAANAGEALPLVLELDARDLPRRLLHTRLELPCKPGRIALWFPKWVPGTHAPCGPVEDVAGLRLETAGGKSIAWHRDETEPYRVECDVPAEAGSIVVRLDTICNAASIKAMGYLSYGNRSVGILNW